MREIYNEITIPEKCRNCPKLSVMEKALAHIVMRKFDSHQIAEAMMDERFDELADSLVADIPEEIKSKLIGNQDVPTAIKQGMAEDLTKIDSVIEKLHDDADQMTRSCDGALKMKASSKGGKEFIVTICTSPSLYMSGQDNPSPSTVRITKQ